VAQAEAYAKHLVAAMAAFDISTPMRQAMFLANIGHESQRLTRTVENLNYRVEALLSMFGRHRITEADARRFGRSPTQPADQAAIANCIYGGSWGAANLGNTQAGDGAKFRGRGLIQNTGRYNAARARDVLRAKLPGLNVPDFEASPDQLALPQWASYSAAEYIGRKQLNGLADSGNFDGYCDSINIGRVTTRYGDAEGWEDRLALFSGAKVALGVA
jgi:putative chitinase